jgi:hypothetical protein
MRAEHPLTKQDVRRYMSEHEAERRESERNLPPEQRHIDHEWLRDFWRRALQ